MSGMADIISKETGGLKIFVADDPLTAVARGTGAILEDLHKLHQIYEHDQYRSENGIL